MVLSLKSIRHFLGMAEFEERTIRHGVSDARNPRIDDFPSRCIEGNIRPVWWDIELKRWLIFSSLMLVLKDLRFLLSMRVVFFPRIVFFPRRHYLTPQTSDWPRTRGRQTPKKDWVDGIWCHENMIRETGHFNEHLMHIWHLQFSCKSLCVLPQVGKHHRAPQLTLELGWLTILTTGPHWMQEQWL